jgi:hypothetical protein
LIKITAVVAITLAVVMASLVLSGRTDLVIAALVAWTASLAGAIGGYWFGVFPRGDLFIASRLLASMLVRAGIPLVVIAICKFRFPELMEGGMVWFVVLFYLVGLLADAILLGVRSREVAGLRGPAGQVPQIGNRD